MMNPSKSISHKIISVDFKWGIIQAVKLRFSATMSTCMRRIPSTTRVTTDPNHYSGRDTSFTKSSNLTCIQLLKRASKDSFKKWLMTSIIGRHWSSRTKVTSSKSTSITRSTRMAIPFRLSTPLRDSQDPSSGTRNHLIWPFLQGSSNGLQNLWQSRCHLWILVRPLFNSKFRYSSILILAILHLTTQTILASLSISGIMELRRFTSSQLSAVIETTSRSLISQDLETLFKISTK